VTLWDALKYEILNVQEEDLAQDSLLALSVIAQQLPLSSEGALNAYLKPIIKESNEHLEDAPTKQSQAAGRILHSVAKASPDVADAVIKSILPNLFTLFQASESITKRRGLVEVLNSIINATEEVSVQWQTKDADGIIINDRASTNALRAFTADTMEILLRAVINAPKAEVSFRLYALDGLTALLKIRQLLGVSDVSRIVDACVEIVIREPPSGQNEIKSSAIKSLTEASHHHPGVVSDKAFPILVAELPDCPEAGIFTYEPALEALAKLSTEPQIVDTIIIRIRNKLTTALHQHAPRSYILALTTALLYIFTHGSPGRDEGVLRLSYFWDIFKPLLDQALGTGLTEESLLTSEVSVDTLSRVCGVIIRPQSSHVQNQAWASFESVFNALQAERPTPEAQISGHAGSKLGVIASLYLYAAFNRDIIALDTALDLIKALSRIALEQSTTPVVRSEALRHTALLVNKFIPSKDVEQALSDANLSPHALLKDTTTASPYTIRLAFAICKGLTIQGKSQKVAGAYLQRLLELLADPLCGPITGRAFAMLLSPDDVLTKENHCIISGLHRQRVYNQISTAIGNAVKVAVAPTKANYLIALSGVLRWLPYGVIQPSLSTIVPLLLQSLDLTDASHQDIKAGTLSTLESILYNDAATLAEHISSLSGRLLNSTSATSNSAETRKGALLCLKLLPLQMKREAVLPYRKQVIKRLMACLDDRKRDVRSEAVRCRSNWLVLDDDDEEE